MNVVVSAIVDPWVTTLSFVVALAMRIQGQNPQNLFTFQARIRTNVKRINRLSREGRAKCASFAHTAPNKKTDLEKIQVRCFN